ncbi:hypothetical protein ACH9EU_01125 [Kocuria sp. M1R5S2]|uniref:hypothetical protein n=1 Tax=Kocuria rhizosphaerae TaxID=3376285 RepID=UPI00379852BA
MHDGTDSRVMRTVYTIFLGVLLALFVGLGITTFHPGPEEPTPPPAVAVAQEQREPTPEERQEWLAYEREREAWEDENMRYSRDVGIAALVASVVLLAVGMLVERRRPVLADGALLAGLFTLLHSVTRSLISRDTIASFTVVTVALVLVLLLGYRRFVDRPSDSVLRSGAPAGADDEARPPRR